MDIRETEFYYFTLDLDYNDVIPCTFVKQLGVLNAASGREVIIVKFTEAHPLKTQYLILVPRDTEESFFNVREQDIVGAYVFDGTPYLDKEEVDINELEGKYIDIGALTPSLETAKQWKS